jgi:hypothetical protein
MSDQGEEGQVPEPPGLEGRGALPPRPTVREGFRRGLFVRLPSEGEAEEGVGGAEEQSGENLADQYPEQVADPYPGWRQAADGSWEAVSPEAQSYVESVESAAAEPYPESDQSANFASVAGGEPFSHEETGAEAPAWTFAPEQEYAQAGEDAVVPVTPQPAEIVSGVMPEAALEPVPEAPVAEPAPEVAPEPVMEAPIAEAMPSEETAPPAETAEVAPEETAPELAAEYAPTAEVAAATEATPEATADEDPVAGTGLYIPADVELLEGDMPLYSEKDKVPPRFAGSGLGEPFFIEFGDLARTLTGLRRLLPKGTRLTYNYDYERAWVRTSAEIDLPSFAERIEVPAAESEKASS